MLALYTKLSTKKLLFTFNHMIFTINRNFIRAPTKIIENFFQPSKNIQMILEFFTNIFERI